MKANTDKTIVNKGEVKSNGQTLYWNLMEKGNLLSL